AGGERAARAREDDRTDRRIRDRIGECRARLAHELGRQGVADLRAIENDPARGRALLGADDGRGAHAASLDESVFTDSKTSTGTSSSMRSKPWASVLPWWSTRSDNVPPPPSASFSTKLSARRFGSS